ncbi:hypothetical protein IX317_002160 [Fusobacterium sp. DD29]|uniref:acetyl-CoA carboxylase biotin carboxyl carrier protein n=1 Tax=unclassified Fusobacterium TaxID=2648384 RepID=UPI001B8D3E9F|nr:MULTISPECIES: biotin/lipoyl-containing protein [unclassified Fusobacterium]MBR8702158.1 hypothetical protein [Fusobacterium sp. DD45]MBR8711981.1 hypothetical protein [Fusobacterium sp. DD28]MBR8750438.1 hypothetical protein [Fusobacterium sp. DD29]MBR8752554.1 hypothetical protein [Fusobacterium sp. DD26]MBR8762675.1 hypothetical protein [Fusobacterium sp. DD25]
MKGDMQTVEELMKILQEKKLTEISFETSDVKITIKADPVQEKKKVQEKPKKKECNEEKIDKNHKDIVSEHVGRYNFIKKDGSPIISIGQSVKEGEELGNVIAVGVALPVVSKFSGVIEDIYVKNGDPVDYGKPLIKVKIS